MDRVSCSGGTLRDQTWLAQEKADIDIIRDKYVPEPDEEPCLVLAFATHF